MPLYQESCKVIEGIDDTEIEFSVANTKNWCTLTNTNSIFCGNPLSDFDLKVISTKTGEIIISGNISSIQPIDSFVKARIGIKADNHNLDKYLTKSYIDMTLDDLLYTLAADYSISLNDANLKSLEEVQAEYHYSIWSTDDGKLKVGEVLQQMAETLGIWIYTIQGKVYLANYLMPNEPGYRGLIKEYDILTSEQSYQYNDIINQYNIKYYLSQEQPATDTDNNNVGKRSRTIYGERATKEIDASQQNNFVIMTKEGAIKAGENYIKRYIAPVLTVKIELPIEYAYYLVPGDIVTIDNDIIRYQIITKETNVLGSKVSIEMWGL